MILFNLSLVNGSTIVVAVDDTLVDRLSYQRSGVVPARVIEGDGCQHAKGDTLQADASDLSPILPMVEGSHVRRLYASTIVTLVSAHGARDLDYKVAACWHARESYGLNGGDWASHYGVSVTHNDDDTVSVRIATN